MADTMAPAPAPAPRAPRARKPKVTAPEPLVKVASTALDNGEYVPNTLRIRQPANSPNVSVAFTVDASQGKALVDALLAAGWAKSDERRGDFADELVLRAPRSQARIL